MAPLLQVENLTIGFPRAEPVRSLSFEVGAGETLTALDLGQGRWVFPRGTLEPLSAGRARIVIEVETSCGGCDVARGLRANWSSRTELEVPVTLL